MVILVGYLHVVKRLDEICACSAYGEYFFFPVLFYSFGDGGIKGDNCGSFLKGVLHLFELVFILRDTFCTAWNKEGKCIKLFWTTLFMMGPLSRKKTIISYKFLMTYTFNGRRAFSCWRDFIVWPVPVKGLIKYGMLVLGLYDYILDRWLYD